MKKLCLIIFIVILLSACSNKGKVKIYNKTNFEIEYSISSKSGTVPAKVSDEEFYSKTIELDLGKNFLVWGSDEKKYDLYLQGDTFVIEKEYEVNGEEYFEILPSTKVKLKDGETLEVYCDPNRCCLIVNNNSEKSVDQIIIEAVVDGKSIETIETDIQPGNSQRFFLEYAYEGNEFSYIVRAVHEGESINQVITYGQFVPVKDEKHTWDIESFE